MCVSSCSLCDLLLWQRLLRFLIDFNSYSYSYSNCILVVTGQLPVLRLRIRLNFFLRCSFGFSASRSYQFATTFSILPGCLLFLAFACHIFTWLCLIHNLWQQLLFLIL